MDRRRSRSCKSRNASACKRGGQAGISGLFRAVVGIGLLLITSLPLTAGGQSRPAWVDTPPLQEGWYFGVAGATYSSDYRLRVAKRQATEQAIAELQQSIQARVRSRATLNQLVEDESVTQLGLTQTDIQVAEMELSGLTTELYVDEAEKTVWALASLQRSQSVSRLQREKLEREQKLGSFRFDDQLSPLSQLLSVRPVREDLARLSELDQQLWLLGAAAEPAAGRLQLERQLGMLLQTLRIAVSPQSEEAWLLQSGTRELVSRSGALVVAAGEPADLQLQISLTPRRQQRDARFHTLLRGQFRFVDQHGQVLSVFSAQGKGASGIDADTADQNAIRALNGELSVALGDDLLATLTGQPPRQR